MARQTAFAALRIKDAAEAIAPILCKVGIVIGALALLCLNSQAFMAVAVVALVIAAFYAVARLIAFISNQAIRSLGFTEPGLERMALA